MIGDVVVDVIVRCRTVQITMTPPASSKAGWFETHKFIQAPIGQKPRVPRLAEIRSMVLRSQTGS